MTSIELIQMLHQWSQEANAAFAKSPITRTQLIILNAVANGHGTSQTRIVAATGVDRSTTADTLRRLHNRKLVERKRATKDTRSWITTLTPAGADALAIGKAQADAACAHLERRGLDRHIQHRLAAILEAQPISEAAE